MKDPIQRKQRIIKQETLSQFETRKDKVKFKNTQEVYERLKREFNSKGLFYRYFLYFDNLKKSKGIKNT